MGFSYDVVIVGAGPAGCAAALQAPEGLSVLMVDRLELPRDLICGGILRPSAVRWFAPAELPPSVFRRPAVIDWQLYDLHWGRSGGLKNDTYFNLDRQQFDEWLLALARNRSNLDLWTGCRFQSVQSGGNSLTPLKINLLQGGAPVSVTARYLVAADGAASSVRRFLGVPQPLRWNMVQASLLSQGAPVDRFLAYIGEGIDFYGWVIPKDDQLLVGIGCDSAKGAGLACWQSFRDQIKERWGIHGEMLQALKARPSVRLRRASELWPGQGRILATGEAAGLIAPWSGEGINYALTSGSLAGQALAAADPLAHYRRELRRQQPRLLADLTGRKLMKRPRLRLLAATITPTVNFKKR